MDSLFCPAGTGMWRIKMKIKKPSHIIKGGGFRVSKIMFHSRTQIQIPSNQHGSIGRFLILLVRIALVTVTDLGRGGAAFPYVQKIGIPPQNRKFPRFRNGMV